MYDSELNTSSSKKEITGDIDSFSRGEDEIETRLFKALMKTRACGTKVLYRAVMNLIQN